MNYSFAMKVLEPQEKTSNYEFGFRLCKFFSSADMMAKISTRQIIHHQVERFSILERLNHVD